MPSPRLLYAAFVGVIAGSAAFCYAAINTPVNKVPVHIPEPTFEQLKQVAARRNLPVNDQQRVNCTEATITSERLNAARYVHQPGREYYRCLLGNPSDAEFQRMLKSL